MSFIDLFILSVGMAMDAFAVSVCKGTSLHQLKWKHMLSVGCWFGVFQALMPLIGYLVASSFHQYIVSFDHWIAFALLTIIGINMIREAFSKDEGPEGCNLSFREMLLLAVATSIDALAVGVTLAMLPDIRIIPTVLCIGIVTFLISAAGVKIGNIFGNRFKNKAQLAGGIIIILIGLKILLEHLSIINF